MTSRPLASRYDVIVIGARCAGAATAMLLARAGLRVLLADRGDYGSDTLSTHALMRGAVLQLQRWGVLPQIIAAGTPPVRRTSFHYGETVVEVAIKPKHGVEALYAPRRTVLDRALVDAAAAAGVDVRFGLRLVDLLRGPSGRVGGVVLVDRSAVAHRVDGLCVVGADGMRSTLAKLVGAPVYRSGQHATGVVYSYWPGLGVDGYGWHYNTGVGTGVIPTNNGDTLVFAGVKATRWDEVFGADLAGGFHRLLCEAAPALAERVVDAAVTPHYTGFSGQAGYFRQSYGPGWALVGDAGYFKDPLTAHGITDALRDAELLADAILEGDSGALARYQSARDDFSDGLFRVTESIASFEWTTATIGGLLEALAREMAAEVNAMADRAASLRGVRL